MITLVRGSAALAVVMSLVGCARKDAHPVAPAHAVSSSRLDVGFRGNEKYGLSGVAWLKDATTGAHAFSTVGLQFEHIISGIATPWNFMTPRFGPFPMTQLADGARLERRADDEPWGVSSALTYRVVAPDAIDFEFRATIGRASLFGPPAFASFFFASYMGLVEDPDFTFRGYEGPGQGETWVRTRAGSAAGEHYVALGSRPTPAAPGDELAALNLGNEEWPRIAQPFYVGRVSPGLTYAVMFDRLVGPGEEIRFTIMRWQPRTPAWDFQYVAHDLTDGRRVGFRGRLVLRSLATLDDIERDFAAWRRGLAPWSP